LENNDGIEISPLLLEEVSSSSEVSFENQGVSPLFSDETMPGALMKLTALEAFLCIVVRDYSFSDFIRQILITMMNAVKSEAGSFLEVDHQNKSLFFRSVVGSSSDSLINFTIPIGQGIVGHVAEAGSTLVVDHAPENQVHLRSIAKAVGFEARNLVAIPVFIRGKIFGVVELLNRVGEAGYSQKDVELLNYLANMAAKTIEMRLMINWGKKRIPSESPGEAA
jgi:putative methionine-R-sulfoxide reductase with GAF domain